MKPVLRLQSCLLYRKAYKPERRFKPGLAYPAISCRLARASPQTIKYEYQPH